MTSKPISQRLKECGFDCPTKYAHDTRANVCDDYGEDMVSRGLQNLIPAYDAETLFMWLRPYGNKKDIGWFINHNEIVVSLHEGRDGIAEFKTSLADMLGEAIIWILENK